MPASVNVNVSVNDGAAIAQLKNLDSIIDNLNKKGVKIKVDVSGGQGGNSAKNAQAALRSIEEVASEAGYSMTDLGKKTKSVTTKVQGEIKDTVETFEQGVGKSVQVSAKGRVKVTEDLKAIEKEQAKSAAEAEKAAKKQADAQQKALQQSEASVNKTISRIAKVGTALAAAFVIKNVKEALGTMKEVDSELANIRKVTDESAASIEKLGRQAYTTASKYGVSAKDYLAGASGFAKAGYKNYADLAELAIKTQLVGDVTADTAEKFLLSADAAYKFGGNVDQLSTVLDRANIIENNYATSIDKIATGLPIVASTASMANMSMDELMASLGTITAVTQETGTKAATALRALILNITGQVGEVIDEDLTVTQESVNSMADALRKYGSEAIKAAQATGDLVDPMEAIRSLSEAYKNGDLSRNELFDILTGVGGKLRTNQLAALVENFDMFEEMLSKVENAAGSADKEIEVMLDTWEAKANILKNTWTQFVSDIVDSDTVKGFITGLTEVIAGLDNAIKSARQTSVETAEGKISDVASEYEKLFGENGTYKKEIDQIKAQTGELSDFDQKRLTYLQEQEKIMRMQVGDAQDLAREAYSRYPSEYVWKERYDEYGEYQGAGFVTRAQLQYEEFSKAFYDIIKEDGSRNRRQISEDLDSLIAEYEDYFQVLNKMPYWDLIKSQEASDFVKLYNKALDEQEEATKRAAEESARYTDETIELADSQQVVAKSFGDTASAINSATSALEAYKAATQGEKTDNANAFQKAYKTFYEDWKAGRTDTNAVNAAFDMFFSPEVQKGMGYNMQAMGELLASDLYQGIYNGASGDAGIDFANYLKDNMTDQLAEIVKINERGDGTFGFEYSSIEALAKYFNLSTEAMGALIQSLDTFGIEVEMGWEEANNLAESLGLVGENGETAGKSISEVAKGLVELGYTDPKKISSVISTLSQKGFLQGLEGLTPEQIGEAISNALEGEGVEVPVEPKVEPEQVEEAIEGAVGSGTGQEIEAEVKLTVSDPGDAEGLKSSLEEIPGVKEVTITESGAVEATVEATALKDVIDQIEDKNVDVSADVSGIDQANQLLGLIDSLHSKTINITTNFSFGFGGGGGGGDSNPDGTAEGTKNASGGPTLVNELGPELISDHGKAYIANGGKPAIVNLNRGAIVLTAEETKEAFNGGASTFTAPAAAEGIPDTGGSGGGGGGWYEEAEEGEEEAGKSFAEAMEEQEDWLKDYLKLIDANIELQHNKKNHQSEYNHYMQLAIDGIKKVRDMYLENGYTEDSVEVATLANKIYDYEKDIEDAKKHAIEDLEDELDNIDKRIKLAENQNDLQKALELENEAKAKLAELIRLYREQGFSDTSEEILTLVNKGYDYDDDSQARLKVMREDLLDTIKAIRENQEDEDELAEKQKAVDEGREALTNAQQQRNVRIFNPVTGQWEWVANAGDIKSAEENLRNAETALTKTQQSRELDALQKALESGTSLDNITLGPALTALISGATLEQQNDFASALGLLYGGMLTTADTSAKSVFDSVDSHDTVTQYIFNDMVIDSDTAANTTLSELATNIRVLGLTENMPS